MRSAGSPTCSTPRPPTKRPGLTVARRRASASESPAIATAIATSVGQRSGRAGEVGRAGDAEASVRRQLDPAADRPVVDARRQPARRRGVGDQDGAVQPLGPQHRRERVGRQVMAVGDEGRGQPVLGELRPEEVRVPGQGRGDAVAEMRREAGAGLDRGARSDPGSASVCPIATCRPHRGKRPDEGGEPRSNAATGSRMPTRPPQASCQRSNSPRSGGRTHSRG